MYKSAWIVTNGVPTHIKTWGGWIEDKLKSDSVIILLTGNPGITDFYEKFLSTLHELTEIPVWSLNHAGNEIPEVSEGMILPSINDNPDMYDVNGQIMHKKAFISTYTPQIKNIYLIGHSFGAKICVELLKDACIAEKVEQVHLMCPTLQNIAETPNGKFYNLILGRIAPILIILAGIFALLPLKIRKAIITIIVAIYSCSFKLETCCIRGITKLFTSKSLKSVLFLANDELKIIKELDNEVYEKYYDKMYVYFCRKDRWAPLFQYEDLKEKHPNLKYKIFDPSFQHSFVFTRSEAAATELCGKINR